MKPPRLLSDRQLAERIQDAAAHAASIDDDRQRFSAFVAALTGSLKTDFPKSARALWCDVLRHEPDDDHHAHVDAYWHDRLARKFPELRAVFSGAKK